MTTETVVFISTETAGSGSKQKNVITVQVKQKPGMKTAVADLSAKRNSTEA